MEGILKCKLTSVPLRADSSDASEIVSQILYGEYVNFSSIGERDWIRVECTWDGYSGWVDKKQFEEVQEQKSHRYYCFDKINEIQDPSIKLVGIGSIIDEELLKENAHLQIYSHEELEQMDKKELFGALLIKYLNAPYLWGGRSITGIDCSGLTQVWYSFFGVQLPRDASQQCIEGELIGFLKEARLGDLAFFENKEGKVLHVGIILDNNKIIHAAGQVRIDVLTNEGIISQATGLLTHNLRVIRRVFSFN